MSGEMDSGPVTAAPEKGEGATFLYDYFKHLTSLSILTLGGVLAISQRGGAEMPARTVMYAIVAFVSLAAVLAFSGSSDIVRQKVTGKAPGKWQNFYRITSPICLGVGVGMFLALYLEGLGI